MAGVQLDELEKAQRSMRVSIFNSTLRVMTRQKVINHQGTFRVQPPETIDSLSTVEFGSESSGMMTGTEAGAIYVMQGVQGFFEFGWNNPYFGKRGYKKIAPTGFEAECSAIDGTNCAVSFVVTETAPQRSEAEIQQEKMKVDAALTEMERVVKGIEKMLTVYASKKDTKNAKVVEDEITAKQHDMDQARARLHSLNLELEKKVKEDDPLYIQQELQKIKGKIEAAARVRKGIEMMKDMYSSGSQKDPRQAQMVDQQLESKKREMDALHKFEQRLEDRLTKVNSGALSHTVADHGANAQASIVPPAGVSGVEGGAHAAAPHALEGGASMISPATVRARILFEVVPNSDTELALQAGDIVVVLDKSGAEWWEGEFDGKTGYFPAAYAELIQESSEADKGSEYTYPKATVITEYTASAEGELSLKLGDTITVYGWDDAYWWEGSKGGVVGFFPCNSVQWIDTNADATGTINTSDDYYEHIGHKDDHVQVDHVQADHAQADHAQADHAQADHAHADHAHAHAPVPAPVQPVHDATHENTFQQIPIQHPPTEAPHEAPTHHELPPQLPSQPATSEEVPLLSAPQEPSQPEPTFVLPPEPFQTEAPLHIEPLAIVEHPPPEPAPRKTSQPPPVIHAIPDPQVTAPRKSSQPPPPQFIPDPQVTAPRKSSQPPPPREAFPDPQTPLPPQPQSQIPQPTSVERSKSSTTLPSTTSPVKPPVSAAAVGTALRKAASGGGSTSSTSLNPAKPAATSSAKPRALPIPAQQTNSQALLGDTIFNSYREGIKHKTLEFATVIEQYTASTVSQYLDTISKLQDRVKELETLNAQVSKERDDLKISSAQLMAKREDATDPKNFTNRRSFWEEAAHAVKK